MLRPVTTPFLLVLLLVAVPSAAADYWPTDTARTYVFAGDLEEIRLVIDPRPDDTVDFVVVSEGCDIRWNGSFDTLGRVEVSTASFFCPGVVDPALPLIFDPGSILFDPATIGGNIQLLQAETEDGAVFDISVRIGAPRTIEVGGTNYETVLFELGIQDPLLQSPFVFADLNIDDGPVRVNGLDRTEVLSGVVGQAESSWGSVKARFD